MTEKFEIDARRSASWLSARDIKVVGGPGNNNINPAYITNMENYH